MRRRAGALLLFLVAAALQLAAAWAPGATELTLAPATGTTGSSFTVTGRGFTPGPVLIYWDDVAGPVLATAAGPEFSVTMTVPDAAAGSHEVLAIADDAEESADFQVTGPTTSSPRTTVEPTRSVPAVGGGTGVEAAPDLPTVTTPPGTAVGAGGAASPSSTVAPTPAPATLPVGAADATAIGAPGTPGAPGADGTGGGDGTAAGGDTASGGQDVPQVGTGLAAAPAGPRSSGIGSPVLLAVGTAMVLGGGGALVVRNRRRGRGTA